MNVAHGIYTGDGNDNRNITGLGFDPHLVIIHGSGSGAGAWRCASHSGDDASDFAGSGANTADQIQSFITDGFQIGTHADVNNSGTTYYWMAFRDNGDGDFTYGTYTGDGVDNRDISGLGFDPSLVAIKGDYAARGAFRTTSHTGDSAYGFIGAASNNTDRIQSFGTGSFQIGTSSYVNNNGTIYYWFAFKEIANEFDVGTYTGNATDNRSITGVGFQPDIVICKESSTSYGVIRTSDHSGDSSLLGAGSNGADRIQGFAADGFEIGTSGAINQSGIIYVYLAWKDVAAGGTTHELAGTIAAESTLSGGLETNRALSGSVAAQSSVSGGLTIQGLSELAGTIAAQSNVSGSLENTISLGGSISAASGVSGGLQETQLLSGSIAAQSGMTGGLSIAGLSELAGTISATSDVSGGLSLSEVLAGGIDGQSDVSGGLSVEKYLTGVIGATSNVTGALETVSESDMAGTIAAQSNVSAELRLLKALTGDISAQSGVSGVLTVHELEELAGTVAAQSGMTGGLSVTWELTGAVAGLSALTGSLTVTGLGMGVIIDPSISSLTIERTISSLTTERTISSK